MGIRGLILEQAADQNKESNKLTTDGGKADCEHCITVQRGRTSAAQGGRQSTLVVQAGFAYFSFSSA